MALTSIGPGLVEDVLVESSDIMTREVAPIHLRRRSSAAPGGLGSPEKIVTLSPVRIARLDPSRERYQQRIGTSEERTGSIRRPVSTTREVRTIQSITRKRSDRRLRANGIAS